MRESDARLDGHRLVGLDGRLSGLDGELGFDGTGSGGEEADRRVARHRDRTSAGEAHRGARARARLEPVAQRELCAGGRWLPLLQRRGGVAPDGSSNTVHLVALDNNDFWNRPTSGAVAAYRFFDGNMSTYLTFAQLPTLPTPTPSANLPEDPLLDTTFRIAKASPVIGKGTSTEAPANDIDGKPRPKGAIDIGAYQAK